MKASDRVAFNGKPIDRLTAERMKSVQSLVKSRSWGAETSPITVLQGIGGASASAGTHTSGGCVDTTAYNWRHREKAGRLFGGADYHRPYNWDNRGGGEHIHFNTIGVGYASIAAQRQWTAYYAGKNALANNAKDVGPRLITKPLFVAPWTDRGKRGTYYLKAGYTARAEGSTKAKALGAIPKGAKFTVIGVVNVGGTLWAINVDGKHLPKSVLTTTKPAGLPTQPKPVETTRLRIGHFNLPGRDKLANEPDRFKAAAAQVNAANLAVLGTNELVGPGSDGTSAPSPDAKAFLAALGAGWKVLVPTTAWDENYIYYRPSEVTLVKQNPDKKLYAKVDGKAVPGRHLASAVFRVNATGREVLYGVTHLVNGNEPGAAAQSVLVEAELTRLAAGRPRILTGDMNTDKVLLALTRSGMQNARLHAKATTAGANATYVNYSKATPSLDPEWIIDQVYVEDTWSVRGYTVVLGLDSDGHFIKPRPSDHMLVIVSVEGK